MARTVNCVILGKEAEGLDWAPYPGELGQRIYDNVSKEAWQRWLSHQTMLINEYRLTPIEPDARKRYTGPLVILTGPNTMSTSEDFLVPLDYSGRALIVGEPTAGTTGNPVNVRLPGGAILRVCSLWSTYPDGREFVGRGIEPHVVVHPTVAGIRANRDEVLQKAVEVLGNWGAYQRDNPDR